MLCQLGEDGGGDAGCREIVAQLTKFGRLPAFVGIAQHRQDRAITARLLYSISAIFRTAITPVFDSEVFVRDNDRFILFDRDHAIFVFEHEGNLQQQRIVSDLQKVYLFFDIGIFLSCGKFLSPVLS